MPRQNLERVCEMKDLREGRVTRCMDDIQLLRSFGEWQPRQPTRGVVGNLFGLPEIVRRFVAAG